LQLARGTLKAKQNKLKSYLSSNQVIATTRPHKADDHYHDNFWNFFVCGSIYLWKFSDYK
jgi:hypothetical protein